MVLYDHFFSEAQDMYEYEQKKSCMTAFSETLNTKLYELELLMDNQNSKRIAVLTLITTNDDFAKKVSTSNTTYG